MHRALQQVLQPAQMVPAMVQPPAAVTEFSLHVPRLLPGVMVHRFEQQSVSLAHTSFICRQNEDALEQVPPWHRPEQHSVFAPQLLPALLQPPGFSGTHTFEAQLPLQHAPGDVQAAPSDTQATAHLLEMQALLQHSLPKVQAVFTPEHKMGCVHLPVFGSQAPEQQSMFFWHTAPKGRQFAPQLLVFGSQMPEQH